MTIQDKIVDGSIRFFRFDPSFLALEAFEHLEITDDTIDLTIVEARNIYQSHLEKLYQDSPTFRNLIGNFTPESSLWIGITDTPNEAQGGRLPVNSFGYGGFAVASNTYSVGLIDQNGNIIEADIYRVLAHEVAHASLGTADTIEPLNGSMPDPDYAGETVRLYENVIMEEAFGITSYRTTYSSMTELDNLTERENWSFGREIDLVHIAKASSGGATQPGFDIDTSSNTKLLRDLIVYVDEPGDPTINDIKSGDGDDIIFAGNGDDVIDPGNNDDIVLGEQGKDTIFGSSGSDLINGGDGKDTLSYENIPYGVVLSVHQDATQLGEITFRVEETSEVEEWQDLFFDVEIVKLTEQDDIAQLSSINIGSISIDGGEDTLHGDTVDFGELSVGATIDLDTGVLSHAPDGNTINLLNFENIIGSDFIDEIMGDDSRNLIDGGDGGDVIDGGLGRDYLLFDPTGSGVKINFDTGAGEDGDAQGDTYLNMEGAVGTFSSDTFIASAGSVNYFAGSGGDDHFYNAASGTAVFWGGNGADTFYMKADNSNILVVNAPNISEENFHELDLDMIVTGVDWDKIGAVIINPNRDDTVKIQDHPNLETYTTDGLQHATDMAPGYSYWAYNWASGENETIFDKDNVTRSHFAFAAGSSSGIEVRKLGADMLEFGAGISGIGESSPATILYEGVVSIPYYYNTLDPLGEPVDPSSVDLEDDAVPDYDSVPEFDDEPTSDHRTPVYHVAEYGVAQRDYYDSIIVPPSPVQRFIAGGTYSGNKLLSDDQVTVTLPEGSGESFWSLLSNGTAVATSAGIGSQSGSEASEVINLSSASSSIVLSGFAGNDTLISGSGNDLVEGGLGNDRVSGGEGNDDLSGGAGVDFYQFSAGDGQDVVLDFAIARDFIEIGGQLLNPSSPPVGVSIVQSGADTEITYGAADSVMLKGVTLSEWIVNHRAPILGTLQADTLTGGNIDELFSSDAGDDVITASGGDDVIIYTSGNDLINGGGQNKGFDTLDLGQYQADAVTMRADGHNLLIDTPDGTITLKDQLRYAIGHSKTNIERVVFSDGELDDNAIRLRVLSDQATDGDDTITGTNAADIIAPGAGNDTIAAKGGDDTIIYTSGNDTILGNGENASFDTLDLNKYTSGQVSFRADDQNMFIDTPDGTITLHGQFRYAPGHHKTNIEQIVFSDATLNEQAIWDRALSDQQTSGDDVVNGTRINDNILDGAGNDTIAAKGGDDTIVYSSGNDIILGNNDNTGSDTLDLSIYSSDQVTFDIDGNHVLVTTSGGTITLSDQFRFALGHHKTNIEQIVFSDVTLDEQAIWDRALSDQDDVGDELISGSKFDDKFIGNAGNDTYEGLAGNDLFVFKTGDGQDVIKDYDVANETIEFTGGIVFGDLTITQDGDDVDIAYAVNDVVTVENALASDFTEPEFSFA